MKLSKRLRKVCSIIKKELENANDGIYNTPDIANDEKEVLYEDKVVIVYICRRYSYLEVIGLKEDDYNFVAAYYLMLLSRKGYSKPFNITYKA